MFHMMTKIVLHAMVTFQIGVVPKSIKLFLQKKVMFNRLYILFFLLTVVNYSMVLLVHD